MTEFWGELSLDIVDWGGPRGCGGPNRACPLLSSSIFGRGIKSERIPCIFEISMIFKPSTSLLAHAGVAAAVVPYVD